VYREPLTHAGFLLASTRRMVIATGIANIWARDPFTMTAAQLTLAEAYPDRFLLGLGVSHARLVEGVRGHAYRQPLAKMRAYLDAMDEAAAAYRAVKPAALPPRVLAALGPKMLDLSAERTNGAHTYLVTPEHTAKARAQLGPAPWLVVEQAVVLESDPGAARASGRCPELSVVLGRPLSRLPWMQLGSTPRGVRPVATGSCSATAAGRSPRPARPPPRGCRPGRSSQARPARPPPPPPTPAGDAAPVAE
jgi:probable F420-dependent oxidoreductase